MNEVSLSRLKKVNQSFYENFITAELVSSSSGFLVTVSVLKLYVLLR